MGGMTVRGFRDKFMGEGVGTGIGLGWVELGTWPEAGSLEPRQTTSAEPRPGNWIPGLVHPESQFLDS